MFPISDYTQVSKGVYQIGGENVNVAPFLELFNNQSTESWRESLDEILLMMVVSQEMGQRNAESFSSLYWAIHNIRQAFIDSIKPVIEPQSTSKAA